MYHFSNFFHKDYSDDEDDDDEDDQRQDLDIPLKA